MSSDKISYFINTEEAPKFHQMEGLETTVLSGLSGEKMMMVLNATLPGNRVPIHTHPHEQVGMVISGKARLFIGDEEKIAEKCDFYSIPANIPHGAECLGDEPFVMFDVFYPVREDFIGRIVPPSNKSQVDEHVPGS